MLNVRRPAYSGIAPVDIQWQPLSSEEKELFETVREAEKRLPTDSKLLMTEMTKDDKLLTRFVALNWKQHNLIQEEHYYYHEKVSNLLWTRLL